MPCASAPTRPQSQPCLKPALPLVVKSAAPGCQKCDCRARQGRSAPVSLNEVFDLQQMWNRHVVLNMLTQLRWPQSHVRGAHISNTVVFSLPHCRTPNPLSPLSALAELNAQERVHKLGLIDTTIGGQDTSGAQLVHVVLGQRVHHNSRIELAYVFVDEYWRFSGTMPVTPAQRHSHCGAVPHMQTRVSYRLHAQWNLEADTNTNTQTKQTLGR